MKTDVAIINRNNTALLLLNEIKTSKMDSKSENTTLTDLTNAAIEQL